jgi:hypothetical protein
MHGPDGLRDIGEKAVLNANYLMKKVREDYYLPYDRTCMHEFVVEGAWKDIPGVHALHISKRLMDYGFHPPTNYFPLVVHEALMIEPTETESKQTMDAFAAAMKAIAQEIPSLEIFTFAKPNRMKRMGLENNHRGPAWGPEMHKVIAESKIVINRHGKVADGFAVNYRLFEGTGMGALVVTEQAKNMTDLFAPDQEIITYSIIEDAVKKIKIALENPEATARIAKRGQTRTLETHTFANRAKQVLETLSQLDK